MKTLHHMQSTNNPRLVSSADYAETLKNYMRSAKALALTGTRVVRNGVYFSFFFGQHEVILTDHMHTVKVYGPRVHGTVSADGTDDVIAKILNGADNKV